MPRCEEGLFFEKEVVAPKLLLDSGAPSLYNKLSRANYVEDPELDEEGNEISKEKKKKGHRMGSSLEHRRLDDFSYIHSTAFENYLQRYVEFVKAHEDTLDHYVTVDIINNAEETYRILKDLEAEGLKPLPVYHFGTDEKWLKKYIDEYDYIAIGGMVPLKEGQLIPGLDRLWDTYLTNDRGRPVVKVHGFAITAVNLFWRYPWYSVDSTSAIVFSMYGIVLVPALNPDNTWSYDKVCKKIAISEKSSAKFDNSGMHYDNLRGAYKDKVDEYFEMIGANVEEMRMGHPPREKANFQYYLDMEKAKRNSPFKKILLKRRFFD